MFENNDINVTVIFFLNTRFHCFFFFSSSGVQVILKGTVDI